jgi:hypothetical protein
MAVLTLFVKNCYFFNIILFVCLKNVITFALDFVTEI